jgi:hypothetical protein
MPGCPVTAVNNLPCNWGPIIQRIYVQYGHQDSAGNILQPIEVINKPTNVPCNEKDTVDTARDNPNVGVISIVLVVVINGAQKLRVGRVNTEVPGQPLPGVIAYAEPTFDFDLKDDSNLDDIARSVQFGFQIRIVRLKR